MASALFSLLVLSGVVHYADATFSLNVSGPSWDYTAKDLADTTSQACKDAYSSDIDCDMTLLEIVASMDPNFNPQSSDLASMCTTSCSNALSQYVKDVNAACTQPGDLANIGSGNTGIPLATVATVGEVFQYKYGEACAMNGSNYCYLTFDLSSDWGATKFPCNDSCAVQFYENAHDQPGSGYYFEYFYLVNQTSWWENTFAGGWDTVVQCGYAKNDTSSMSASATASATTSFSAATASISSTTATRTGTIPTKAASSTSTTGSSTVTLTATTSRATSGAGRIRSPFFSFFF